MRFDLPRDQRHFIFYFHRASLPSNEIAALDASPITFTMNIDIFIDDKSRKSRMIDDLGALFDSNDIFKAKVASVNVDPSEVKDIKTPAKLEQLIMKQHDVKPGNLLIVEWKSLKDEILVTSERTIFISDKVCELMNKNHKFIEILNSSLSTASEKLYQVIRTWIVRDFKIRSILGRVMTFDGKQLRHTFPPPSPEYEVLISILNPRPDLQTLHWNVKQASERYLRPFFNEFSELSTFTLKSQWKYQVELKYGSQQVKDDTKVGRHFAMEHDSLPHIITSIERKLGTDVANKPCIHLVVYAPPCQMAPVHIYKEGQRVANFSFDSFISAKWGGIVIANPSDNVCSSAVENEVQQIHIHSHEVMDFVLYELRKIFELEVDVPLAAASMEALDQVAPRLWETDMHLRTGAIHLIASASSTLQSLIRLLDDIKNIVIGDHVAAEIHKAYENVVEAKKHLLVNDIHQAVKFARKAFIAAETAFNDPSLLELLYFPEEQKYAIYIPLYLPIMIPVIFSLSAVRKYFKRDQKVEEKKPEEQSLDETKEEKNQ